MRERKKKEWKEKRKEGKSERKKEGKEGRKISTSHIPRDLVKK